MFCPRRLCATNKLSSANLLVYLVITLLVANRNYRIDELMNYSNIELSTNNRLIVKRNKIACKSHIHSLSKSGAGCRDSWVRVGQHESVSLVEHCCLTKCVQASDAKGTSGKCITTLRVSAVSGNLPNQNWLLNSITKAQLLYLLCNYHYIPIWFICRIRFCIPCAPAGRNGRAAHSSINEWQFINVATACLPPIWLIKFLGMRLAIWAIWRCEMLPPFPIFAFPTPLITCFPQINSFLNKK